MTTTQPCKIRVLGAHSQRGVKIRGGQGGPNFHLGRNEFQGGGLDLVQLEVLPCSCEGVEVWLSQSGGCCLRVLVVRMKTCRLGALWSRECSNGHTDEFTNNQREDSGGDHEACSLKQTVLFHCHLK